MALMPPSHRCPSLSDQRTQIWPHPRPGTLLVQTRQQGAAVGQGAAPRAQPSSGQSPLPNQTRRQQEQTTAPGMEFPPFLINLGSQEVIAVMLGGSLSSGKRRVVMQNLQEPTGSRVWEELASGKGKE